MTNKIKVSSPRQNPHICYISEEYRDKISFIKTKTGQSLYALLCICAGKDLSTSEHIHEYKKIVREKGFRNIGEWAEATIDALYECKNILDKADLRSITRTMEDRHDYRG